MKEEYLANKIKVEIAKKTLSDAIKEASKFVDAKTTNQILKDNLSRIKQGSDS